MTSTDVTRAKGKRRLDADPTIRQDVDICTRVHRSHAADDMMSGSDTEEATTRAHT